MNSYGMNKTGHNNSVYSHVGLGLQDVYTNDVSSHHKKLKKTCKNIANRIGKIQY